MDWSGSEAQAEANAAMEARRVPLTQPSVPTSNEGYDNENSDLILYTEDELWVNTKRYQVVGILGHGTFGQVAKCYCCETGKPVALKVIKNQPAYFHQARMEIAILQYLNSQYDLENKHHIVRMLDFCKFKNHLCIAFELLHNNLYELLKLNHFHGLSLNLVRALVSQTLTALIALRDAGVIHCDLKPENILLENPNESAAVKVIDFGSACFSDHTVYSYIQSRFYRSIEVVLGYPYGYAIDMWSLGCIAAELFLGLPLFPGASEYDLLRRIIEMLGQPSDQMLKFSKNCLKYFNVVNLEGEGEGEGGGEGGEGQAPHAENRMYELMTEEEYEASSNCSPKPGKCYFKHTKLADIVGTYPYRSTLNDTELEKERGRREAFLDFLSGLLDTNPHSRWTPRQAIRHPFITGEDFTGPFQPPPDRPWPVLMPTMQAAAHAQAHAAACHAVMGSHGSHPHPIHHPHPLGTPPFGTPPFGTPPGFIGAAGAAAAAAAVGTPPFGTSPFGTPMGYGSTPFSFINFPPGATTDPPTSSSYPEEK